MTCCTMFLVGRLVRRLVWCKGRQGVCTVIEILDETILVN